MLMQVVYKSFDLQRGLMTATAAGLAYPHPAAHALAGALPQLRMLGLLLGKALFEGILLDVPLAHFFVRRLQVSAALASLSPAALPRAMPSIYTDAAQEPIQQRTSQARRPTFDDLRTVDEDVHRNLITVKRRALPPLPLLC